MIRPCARHGRGLDHDEPGPAEGEATEMGEVIIPPPCSSMAGYWHIGEIAMRFFMVTSRKASAEPSR